MGYKDGNELFINPYNFVSIGNGSKTYSNNEEADDNELYTGYLECELITRTPLAIPDAHPANKVITDEKGHSTYPRYKLNGSDSVIPGSSIRGAIRSAYETITDSCLVTTNVDEGFTGRNGADNAFKPGLLCYDKKKKNWELYEAERHRIPIEGAGYKKYKSKNCNKYFRVGTDNNGKRYIEVEGEKLYYGQNVSFNSKAFGKNAANKLVTEINGSDSPKKGVLLIGEENSQLKDGDLIPGSKKFESIFCKSKKAKNPIDTYNKDEIKAILIELIDDYRDKAINKEFEENHYGYKGFEEAKKNNVIPIWYMNEENHTSISLASIGRYVYQTNIEKLYYNHIPCGSKKNNKNICPACSLFGMNKNNKKEDGGIGSKIRVTDAYLEGDLIDLGKVTLKELAGPKATYFPFYSKANKPYNEIDARIRGRKYYWHNQNAVNNKNEYADSEKTIRNSTQELIGVGTKYTFSVYYDEITKKQLEELIWTINFWENEETGNMCHKLGHGKPIGLGSVKITIKDRVERVKDEFLLNKKEWNQDIDNIVENSEEYLKDELMTICRFDAISKENNITYPYIEGHDNKKFGDNNYAAHQWFTHNKGTGKKEKQNVRYLPDIKDYDKNKKGHNIDLQTKIYVKGN